MSLRDRYDEVTGRIAEAARSAGRAPSEVTLVAVSKRQPLDAVVQMVALGHRDFGENLVQAYLARRQALPVPPTSPRGREAVVCAAGPPLPHDNK